MKENRATHLLLIHMANNHKLYTKIGEEIEYLLSLGRHDLTFELLQYITEFVGATDSDVLYIKGYQHDLDYDDLRAELIERLIGW